MVSDEIRARYRTQGRIRRQGALGNLSDGVQITTHGVSTRLVAGPGTDTRPNIRPTTMRPAGSSHQRRHVFNPRDSANRWLLPLAFAMVALLLLLSRLPLVFLTNFWAEDGTAFYGDAYNLGWLRALTLPVAGYLQTFPRLEAAFAVGLPLAVGPPLASAVALVFDVLPGVLFLSDRFRAVVPSLTVRLALATASVILPDTFELNGNLANVQWHLALLGFLLLVGGPPRTLAGHAADLAGVILVGLSGPFCFLLAPIALWIWLRQRARWLLPRVALLVAAATVQTGMFATHYRQRQASLDTLLHPSPGWFLKVLDRPLLTPLMGAAHYQHLVISPAWHSLWLPLGVLAVGGLTIVYAFRRGPAALRLLLALGAGILALALLSPAGSGSPRQLWAGLATGGGPRYFYIPMLAWITTLVWLAVRAKPTALRAGAIALLFCGLVIAVPVDWRYPVLPETGFRAAAERFDRARPGTTATIPIEPAPTWTMTLTKH
jgi:hypothetical protein